MSEVCENDLSYLKEKDIRFGRYMGQTRCLRKEAINLWGEKDIASLTDFDIENKFKNEGYIPVVIYHDGNNEEKIYLVKREYLAFAICLSRRG